MKQRVAIARALANNPAILLLDEPFGALDAQTRSLMQELLTQVWEELHKTILFVTHDVEEAVFLSDRVFVMTARPGKIKAEIDIPLPRPRSYEIKSSEAFLNLAKMGKMGGKWGQAIVIKYFFLLFSLRFISMISTLLEKSLSRWRSF